MPSQRPRSLMSKPFESFVWVAGATLADAAAFRDADPKLEGARLISMRSWVRGLGSNVVRFVETPEFAAIASGESGWGPYARDLRKVLEISMRHTVRAD